ncbi:ABC transporter permease [soil metagenome]
MLRNYVKIALRNLWRNKLYTGLNVGGLAIGLTACLIMVLYVNHEFSYDTFHPKAGRIVRVTTDMKTPESPLSIASSPLLLADMLMRDYPEVETAIRLQPISAIIRTKDKLLSQQDVYYADKNVFSVFDYQFRAGNPALALADPHSAVVTESFATTYFGRHDVLGQSIQVNKQNYKITGVIADVPSNTDLPISVLLSKKFSGTSWVDDDFPCYTYVLFRNEPDLPDFTKKLAYIARTYANPEFKKMGAEGYSIRFPAELLKDVHYGKGKLADTPKGNKQYGYLFAFLAAFILAIALLNYINLLTAKATERAKEVGVRKANGAMRNQLVRQFLFESFLLSGLAVVLSIVLLPITIPYFNKLLTIRLHIFWLDAIGLFGFTWLVITLLGGLYPAFVLSGYDPVAVLRGTLGTQNKGAWFRKTIIVFQFVLAAGMIAGVLVIHRQMDYMQRYDIGFNTSQILSVNMPDDSTARAGASAFGNSLKQRSEIDAVTLGSGLQLNGLLPMASTSFQTNGKKRDVMSNYLFVDETFLPLLAIRLKEGRNLSDQSAADLNGGILINEAFMKLAGWKTGVGKAIGGFGHKGNVVGVVKNFNYRSLHNPVEPLVLVYNTSPVSNLMLRIKPAHLPVVKAIWQRHYPTYPFEYTFLDESFDAQYRKDRLMVAIFNGFAGLTVLVSCLGLFGLVAFTTERRTKEIGIRKVLGASIVGIVTLLARDFLKLVLIAIVIASPIAWYAMDTWLQDFAYKIDMEWWIFALAGFLAAGIALLTVSFQSVKAALMNPVKSLRTE